MGVCESIGIGARIGFSAGPAVSRAVVDFKNGLYSIGGISKTRAQTVEANATWGNPFDIADIVPGSGLVRTANDLDNDPVLTSEAFAAVGVRFVAVLSYQLDLNSPVQAYITLNAVDLVGFTNAGYLSVGWNASGVTSLFGEWGSYDNFSASAGDNGAHKVAFFQNDGMTAVSLDGGAPATNAIGFDLSLASAVVFNTRTSGNGVGSTITFEKAEFYSVSDFGIADLAALSVI